MMKKIVLMMAIAVGLTTAVNAQEVIKEKDAKTNRQVKDGKAKPQVKTPEERAQKSVDQLNKAVGLTDDQKTKIYDLALNRAKQVDAVREKYKGQQGNKETAKGEIATIKKDYRKAVKSILSPEQVEKLKAKAAEKGADHKGAKGTKGEKGEKGEKDNKKEDDDVKSIGDED